VRYVAHACLSVLLMSSVHAQQVTPQPWLIDSNRSSGLFEVHLRLGIDSRATSKAISGQVQWVNAEQWQVRLVLPVEPLKFSGPAWMDRAAKSKEFLHSKQYPEIVFESAPQPKTLLLSGGLLRGQLHMRGQTRDVQVQLASEGCELGAPQCLLNVTGTVSRKRFGMSASRWTVKDNIDLNFNIRFVPAP
jgi:polyisoprenoid-binding protein YceI